MEKRLVDDLDDDLHHVLALGLIATGQGTGWSKMIRYRMFLEVQIIMIWLGGRPGERWGAQGCVFDQAALFGRNCRSRLRLCLPRIRLTTPNPNTRLTSTFTSTFTTCTSYSHLLALYFLISTNTSTSHLVFVLDPVTIEHRQVSQSKHRKHSVV